jgi:hypothetical protein
VKKLREAFIPIFAVLAAIPFAALGQAVESLDVTEKLSLHVKRTVGPMALVSDAAYAAILQGANAPLEWKQGAEAYGKRVCSMVRYFRSTGTGFWRRSAHALRGIVLTRTDSGGETLSTWRLGSDYGSAFLSNMWYPERLNTVRLGLIQGSVTMGFELAGNLASEFWPDVKRKVLHRK